MSDFWIEVQNTIRIFFYMLKMLYYEIRYPRNKE